jgi:hypothetical protein
MSNYRTLEQAKLDQAERNASVKASTPGYLLDQMKLGNERYRTGRGSSTGLHLLDRSSLQSGQAPKIMLLGCADSRVPTEIIFDQVRPAPTHSRPSLPRRAVRVALTRARVRARRARSRRASATSS